jgi:hypothetical protein
MTRVQILLLWIFALFTAPGCFAAGEPEPTAGASTTKATITEATMSPTSMEIRLPEGAHPRVFLTPSEAEAIRARVRERVWAKPIAEKILRTADALVAAPLDIPHAGGAWIHWYVCRNDDAKLRAESPTRHVCPKCGEVYSGHPYDACYVNQRHTYWLEGVETLGMAYLLDPKPVYARRVRDILMEYPSFYRDLPLHDPWDKQGTAKSRLYAQTLDEAVIACHIVAGYDGVYDDPCFSAKDHEAIETGLLRPMVEVIRANPRAISNWQTWHNAGVCSIGLLLGDREYVDWSINGKNGLLYQLANGSVLASGMWYEESPSYHWYSLEALVYHLESTKRAGMDFYRLPIGRKLFEAPVRQLLPDFTFAPFHDSDRSPIASQRRYYELAYREYRDPLFAALTTPRDDAWSLFWGADDVSVDKAAIQFPTTNDESEGLAILRDAANETVLMLDYGPGSTGHNHPSKLNIVLYAGGDIRFADGGRLAYGNPMHNKWFTQTIAHNTVVVNGKTQNRTRGVLKAFASTPDFDVIRATCDTAYEGVTLDRTILRRGNVFLDIFQCAAETDSVFDLPLHVHGAMEGLGEGTPVESLGGEDGYPYLRDIRKLNALLPQFDIDLGKGSRIHVTTGDNSTDFAGARYATASLTDFDPFLLRRQEGKTALFMTAYEILRPGERAEISFGFTLQDIPSLSFSGLRLLAGDTTRVELLDDLPLPMTAFEIGLDGAKSVPVPPTPTRSE